MFKTAAQAMLAFAALQLAAASALADVYRWTDTEGHTIYGDAPPAGVKARKVEGGVTVVPAIPVEPTPAEPAAAPKSTASEALTTRSTTSAASFGNKAEDRRSLLIEKCKANRGVNCEQEADAMLDGAPAGDGTVYYPAQSRNLDHPPHPLGPHPKPQSNPPKQQEMRMAPMPGTLPKKPSQGRPDEK